MSFHHFGADGVGQYGSTPKWALNCRRPPPPPESSASPHPPVSPSLSSSSKGRDTATTMPEPHASLVTNLAKLLKTGQYSDLKIVCGHREFAESQESVIDLTVDTEPCVSRLVDFLYRCDYDALENDSEEASNKDPDSKDDTVALGNDKSDDEDSKASRDYDAWGSLKQHEASVDDHVTVTQRQLSLHVDMFVLADKYDIDSLADLARRKFKEAAYQPNHFRQWSSVRYATPKLSVLETIPHIYAATGEHNRGLRDVVVEYARLQRSRLERENVFTDKLADLFESVPDFAVEVSQSWLKMPHLGYCEEEHCGRTLQYKKILCGPCREKKLGGGRIQNRPEVQFARHEGWGTMGCGQWNAVSPRGGSSAIGSG